MSAMFMRHRLVNESQRNKFRAPAVGRLAPVVRVNPIGIS